MSVPNSSYDCTSDNICCCQMFGYLVDIISCAIYPVPAFKALSVKV